MVTVSSAQLDAWISTFIYPLFRILAMMAAAPLLGNKQVSRQIKIGLAVMITLIIAPSLDNIPPVSVATPMGWLIILQQIVIGAAMGLTIRVIFNAVEMAGEIISLQMGLGFAILFDPVNGTNSAIIAQWLSVLATLIFLTMDGHHLMIAAVVDSFHTLPIGQAPTPQSFYQLAEWGSSIFYYGLHIALPVLAVLLFINIALGVLTRAAPQLNIFAVGFPITLTVGFLILMISLPHLLPMMDKLVESGITTMMSLR